MQAQHVAELVQRTQQLVTDVQQIGTQRCGHALQILLVELHAPLQCGQRVIRPHALVYHVGTGVLGTQQLLHEAVHLLRYRLMQVVGGFVHRVAVRAPMVQLYHDSHLGQSAYHVVHAVVDRMMAPLVALLVMALLVVALLVALAS